MKTELRVVLTHDDVEEAIRQFVGNTITIHGQQTLAGTIDMYDQTEGRRIIGVIQCEVLVRSDGTKYKPRG